MEGFDPLELAPKGEKLYRGYIKYGNTNINTLCGYLKNNFSVYEKLRNEYDIIYIDLFDSKLCIQANARLLERAIEIINEQKKLDGCSEKNVVLGQSMGGLIARYALKEMEKQNRIHDVSLLVCQDTPHLGAHIPLGVLQGINGLLKFYYNNAFFSLLDIGDIKSKLVPILYSDAAKQMLINYVGDDGYLDNSYHDAWQRELRQMGYPQGDSGYKMRIVSISNGQTSVVYVDSPYIYVDGKASTTIITDLLCEFFAPNIWGMALDVVFDDWQTVVLGLLPGSSTLTVHFEANPPNYKSLPICNMYLRYTKKFLWIAKIRRTIFSYQKTWPSGMIYYDFMPGSFYKLSDSQGEHSDESQAPKWVRFFAKYNLNTEFGDKIMFIPTVSALDIGEGKVELTEEDYKKKYLMYLPPASPKHTPFDAFYITNGSSFHTSFEETMLDWLLEQMSLAIDGPSVATNGAQYTIRNNTKNYATTWSSSNDSIATIDNTGKLTMKESGVITITASCVTEDNITYKCHKKVLVGFPSVVLDYYYDKEIVASPRFIKDEERSFMKYFRFEWKIKTAESSAMNWTQADEWRVTTSESKSVKVTVYMRMVNAEGLASNTMFLSLDATTPYVLPAGLAINGGRNTNLCIPIRPNSLHSGVASLASNERLRIFRIESNPINGELGGSFCYAPTTSVDVPVNGLWYNFSSWINDCYLSQKDDTYRLELLIYNMYNEIIQRKIIQIRYLHKKSFP